MKYLDAIDQFIEMTHENPSGLLYIPCALYQRCKIGEGDVIEFNTDFIDSVNINTLSTIEIIHNGMTIGHLCPMDEEHHWNQFRLFNILQKSKTKIKAIVQNTYQLSLNIYVAFFVEENTEYENRLTKQDFHESVKQNNEEIFQESFGSLLFKSNFSLNPRIKDKFIIEYIKGRLYLVSYLGDKKYAIGYPYDESKISNYEKIKEAAINKRIYCKVDSLKMYGNEYCIHVRYMTYDNKKYIPDELPEYKSYLNLIPENLFNRKKNKTNIWKMDIEENVKLKVGTEVVFMNAHYCIQIIDKKTRETLGTVCDDKIFGTNYINKFYDEIWKNNKDIVFGIILSEDGVFAYCTYNKRNIDFKSEQFQLDFFEFYYGKDSDEYKFKKEEIEELTKLRQSKK